MTDLPEEMVLRAADAALDDLLNRKGVGDELEAVKYEDEETWEEIRQAVGRTAAGVPALLERVAEAEKVLGDARTTIGFLRSVVMSGEDCSPKAKEMTEATLDAIRATLAKKNAG